MNRRRRAGGSGGGGSTDMQDRSINAGVPREGAGSTHPPTPTSTNQSSSESSSSINSDPSGCNNRYPGFPLAVLAIFSIATRMAWLSRPDDVVFDETHVGRFLVSLLRGEYFFDVHPPLGKLLFAYASILLGFDVDDFDDDSFGAIGKDYASSVPYVGLRRISATFGAAVPILAYHVVHALGFSTRACMLAAILLVLDTGLVTQSRCIMLDSILLFFILAAVLATLRMQNLGRDGKSFTASWWAWLLTAGGALGCACSTKFVGFFVVALVGVGTAIELWYDILGSRAAEAPLLPLSTVASHVAARVLGLIAVPTVIYCGAFAIFFAAVPFHGPGDLFMSARFRASLTVADEFEGAAGRYHGAHADNNNNGPKDATATIGKHAMPLNVSYGSFVKLQQRYTAPCWLHSADVRYPLYPSGGGREGVGLVSSHQQVVTCRPPQRARSRKGQGNGNGSENAGAQPASQTLAAAAGEVAGATQQSGDWWQVVNVRDASLDSAIPPVPVHHGDPIAFRHNATGKMLNSHNVAGPMTHTHQEVSCYGSGDEQAPVGHHGHRPRYDSWQLQVLEQEYTQLQAGTTSFKLVHVQTQTALQRTDKLLPSWGMHHTEVVTGKQLDDINGGWIISAHINDRLSVSHTADGNRDLVRDGTDDDGGDDGTETSPAVNAATSTATATGTVDDETISLMPFWEKFIEVHTRMISENNQLTGEHKYSSQADAWPFIHRGVLYWREKAPRSRPKDKTGSSGDDSGGGSSNNGADASGLVGSQIYFLGNPIVWFGTVIAVGVSSISIGVHAIRGQRRLASVVSDRQQTAFLRACFWLCGGWAAHYVPFLLMNRRLFMHHYLPAVCFGGMCAGVLLEHVVLHCFRAPQTWGCLAWALGVAAATAFFHLSPLAYGMPTSNEALDGMELRPSWGIPRFR